MELLLGAGARRDKLMWAESREWDCLTTLDRCDRHSPDVVHDLDELPYPFDDDQFDEIHAYAVLEHCGRQGDWRFFFGQFSEIWRMLKPGGLFFAFVPLRSSPWAWGDPSHTRIIMPQSLVFLDQAQVAAQVGNGTMSDFRDVYRADFHRVEVKEEGRRLYFVLQAVKPSRVQ